MLYNFPYCTFEKLRITNANGIKFRYLTGEGSFFEGQIINDNTFYNDESNCGFNWEPFTQNIPCDGIIRLQFQWCDSHDPLIHIFSNDIFVIEVNPIKVYSASFDIYEVELNFGTESEFCNSCIDLRIATKITDIESFGAIIKSETSLNTQIGNNGNFSIYSVEGTPVTVSVFEYNGSLVVTQKANMSYSVFRFNGSSFVELYNTVTPISFIKAFNNTNWIATGSSSKLIVSKNSTITEENLTISTPFGINGNSVDNFYVGVKPFMAQSRLLHYVSGIVFEEINYPTSFVPQVMNKKDNYIYTAGYKFLNHDIEVLNLSNNTFSAIDNLAFTGTTLTEVSAYSRTSIYASDTSKLYFSNGTSLSIVTGFTTIKEGDAEPINSLSYFGSGVLYVTTRKRVYLLKDNIWSIVYSSSNNYVEVIGYYNTSTRYIYHSQSEPIGIGTSNCLIPIEYWNEDNYDGQYFCDGFKNILYIEAQFIKYSPIETSSVYVTSNNVKIVLSKNIAKKRTLDINYIPEYLHDIVTIAFSMDNLLINGKSFTAESDYKIQDNATLYSLNKASVEVYENLYKFENSNCDNECGGNQPSTPACTLPDDEGFWGGNAEI